MSPCLIVLERTVMTRLEMAEYARYGLTTREVLDGFHSQAEIGGKTNGQLLTMANSRKRQWHEQGKSFHCLKSRQHR